MSCLTSNVYCECRLWMLFKLESWVWRLILCIHSEGTGCYQSSDMFTTVFKLSSSRLEFLMSWKVTVHDFTFSVIMESGQLRPVYSQNICLFEIDKSLKVQSCVITSIGDTWINHNWVNPGRWNWCNHFELLLFALKPVSGLQNMEFS